MKKAMMIALSVLTVLQCSACGKKAAFTVGTYIGLKNISDFRYTYENINFGAKYQNYRFYSEDGKYFFYYETRERPNDYGATTEDDITDIGTITISEDEWETFFSYLKGGTVRKRTETANAGGCGPWTYLYWDKDMSVYREYSFVDVQTRSDFEEYCAALALKAEQTDN